MAYDPNCEETKAAFAEMLEEETKGLKANNTRLMDQLKKAQKGGDNAAELERLQSENEELTGKLTAAERARVNAEKAAKKANETAEASEKAINNLLVDGGLTAALAEHKVAPQFIPAVKAMLRDKVTVKVEGDSRTAIFGDKDLKSALADWVQSDEGKHYVAAPVNGGGGAGGGGGGDPAKTVTRSAFDGMDPKAQGDFVKGGGKVVDA